MIVPCVQIFKSTIDSLSHKYSSRFVATLKASINDRLSKYENIDAFLMASVLDSWFKLKWCEPKEYNELKAKCDQICQKGSYTCKVSSLTYHCHSTDTMHRLTVHAYIIAKGSTVCFYWCLIHGPVWCSPVLGWSVNGSNLPGQAIQLAGNHHRTGWWDWASI